jgi:acetyl coenzyme A synthetase (ADP forming)-like protein
LPDGYPQHRVVHVALRDGSTVLVRPSLPDDLYDVQDFYTRLSRETVHMRFHGLHRVTPAEVKLVINVDFRDRFTLVATTAAGDSPRVIAVANYFRIDESHAEVAVAVDDPFQGQGLGSILVEHLAEAAAENGIMTFEAEVLASNREMLDVLRATQLPLQSNVSTGVVHLEFPTSLTEEAVEAFEQREAVAAAAGVRNFLVPASIAVIGASRNRGSIGGELFSNLLDMRFEGPVYPVNPKSSVVQSVSAYARVQDIPGPVDLAVIVVPAESVLDVARDCAEKSVKGLLIISAGFAEMGDEGKERQDALLEVAREHGMRIIGPNCMGTMNLDPAIRLNASFSPVVPPPGRLAFSSQSGALGIAVMGRARELGLGLSSFVSVGNKADISGNDLLQYWEHDEATDVILLYLESFGNPRKFARIARRVSEHKPIVAVKSGRSQAGARAAASHTGSLAAGDVAVDALFHQTGVIRTDTLEELFDVATLLAHQPLPTGNRVGILTNAGGLGILAADTCESVGLSVPPLTDETTQALRAFLAHEASVGNPVDMIASASAEQYARALELLARDPGIDSIIVIFIPPLVTRAEDVADELVGVAGSIGDKTVLTCFLSVPGATERLQGDGTAIPTYAFPEDAARALGHVAQYASWRATPSGEIPRFPGTDRSRALACCAEALASGFGWLPPDDVSRLLDSYGIRSVKSVTVRSLDEIPEAATGFEGKIALKVVSQKIVHKTDVGGVQLNLAPEDVPQAARAIAQGLEGRGLADQLEGFLLQEMISQEGAEMFVGVTSDPLFGPLIACGTGGTMVELLRDVQVRITPLTDDDAREMIRALKTYPLLTGYRGKPPLDEPALQELLLRISALVEDIPAISELDLNPVLVREAGEGYVVLDARIKVVSPQPAKPRGARR